MSKLLAKFFVILFILIFNLCYVRFSNSLEYSETFRLPNHTIPLTYNLSLIIDDENSKVDGLANIEVTIKNATNEILLNTNYLDNFKINIIDLKNGDNIPNILFDVDENKNLLRIYSSESDFIFENDSNLMLTIKYCAIINDTEPMGIYRTGDDSNRFVITTQFEPTFARRAFPCFDEPNFKARFILTLIHANNLTAVSNMPINGEPITSTQTTTKFQQTPLMSTYLLAFVLHDYMNMTTTFNNITHTIYYDDPQNKIKVEYNLKKSVEVLTVFEEMFNTEYKLKKLDHITVPSCYGDGMENWGLIIYANNHFLIDEKCETIEDYKNVIIMTHEMAHQWFGNLVSPEWWTYAWLNEGFATYYSYVVAEMVFPNCQIDRYKFHLFQLTILPSRSLSTYVENPEDILQIFDTVSYFKGAYVIQMFEQLLGASTFRKGIRIFFQRLQYSNANENDLFDALEIAAKEDQIPFYHQANYLKSVFKTWTNNRGSPVLNVTRNYDSGEIILEQISNTMSLTNWFIPITFATRQSNFNNISIDYVMPATESTVKITPEELNLQLSENDWLILNKKEIGFYQVNYDDKNWQLIANELNSNHSNIDVYNRAKIIKDVLGLIRKHDINIEIGLNIISYLKYEKDLLPWAFIENNIRPLFDGIEDKEINELFKHFLRDIIKPVYTSIKDETSIDNKLMNNIVRSEILYIACLVDLEECLLDSQIEIQKILRNIENDIQTKHLNVLLTEPSLICSGVQFINEEEFKILLNEILLKIDEDELINYLKPLACSKNLINIKSLLSSFLKSKVNKDLFHFLPGWYMKNKEAQIIILDFIVENFEAISERKENLLFSLNTIYMFMPEDDDQIGKYNLILTKIDAENDFNLSTSNENLGFLLKQRKAFCKKYCKVLKSWLEQYKIKNDDTNIVSLE